MAVSWRIVVVAADAAGAVRASAAVAAARGAASLMGAFTGFPPRGEGFDFFYPSGRGKQDPFKRLFIV
ncbi:hypothetical protein GCM10010402_77050 [Actinomadura luteofluorescens]